MVQDSQQCAYQGIWTRAGCNEWAIHGSDYCHAHQQQAKTTKLRNVLFVIFVAAIAGSCGICVVAMAASR